MPPKRQRASENERLEKWCPSVRKREESVLEESCYRRKWKICACKIQEESENLRE